MWNFIQAARNFGFTDAQLRLLKTAGGGSGDVTGAASSTDNAVARMNGAGGKTIQNSGVIVDDSNNVSGVGALGCGAVTSSGNLIANVAGNGFKVKEGSNARMGTVALVAGVGIVANTSVTANTRVLYSVAGAGGTQGFLSEVKNAGVGFTITSTSLADTSTIEWVLIEPA